MKRRPILTGLICAALCFAGAYVIAVRKAAEAAPLYCTDWPPC